MKIAALMLRTLLVAVVAGGFLFAAWRLMDTAPTTSRTRPQSPVPLVDVADMQVGTHSRSLAANGVIGSAQTLEIRAQVGGRIQALHSEFEPGGRVPANALLVQIEPDEFRLAVDSARAELDKAQAALQLERGRSVVAREELASLRGSVSVEAESRSLALREPQLRQVQAELTRADYALQRAELDLARTRLSLPFDTVVLRRERVTDEIVAARELIGSVARADRFWVELSVNPADLAHIRVRDAEGPGAQAQITDGQKTWHGEVIRARADLAPGSRLAMIIVALDVAKPPSPQPLIGSYVRAEVDAGEIRGAISVPRRALRDNDRVWVVDTQEELAIRDARILWSSGQSLLLAADALLPGDRIVVSRITGLIPGTRVRSRVADTGVSVITALGTLDTDD